MSSIEWSGKVTSYVPQKSINVRRGPYEPERGAFQLSRKTFNQLEQWMQENASMPAKMMAGLDAIMHLGILLVQSNARRRSAGPLAPRHRSVPALAYRIPVQRISGAYFAGWTVRKTGRGWLIYNDTVEAYLIEYGMHMRVRRPILKMSVLATLEFIQQTRVIERFTDSVFRPGNIHREFRPLAGNPGTSGGLAGPVGRLPG